MISDALFSSGDSLGTYEWCTPPETFNYYHSRLRFTVDLAATPETKKLDNYLGPSALVFPHYAALLKESLAEATEFLSSAGCNSLEQDWGTLFPGGRGWLNPPYGRGLGAWFRKVKEGVEGGMESVTVLVPARTDTAWWHDHVETARRWRSLQYAGPHMKVACLETFLRGRLKFYPPGTPPGEARSAPFPSVLLHFYRVGGNMNYEEPDL